MFCLRNIIIVGKVIEAANQFVGRVNEKSSPKHFGFFPTMILHLNREHTNVSNYKTVHS